MARHSQIQAPIPSPFSSVESSAAKVAANRANAAYSTGPQTAEGKARVSQNAFKHGLYSAAFVTRLHGKGRAEDRAKYEALLAGLRAAIDPADEVESQIVDNIAAHQWRLARIMEERELQRDTLLAEGGWSRVDIIQAAEWFGIEEDRLLRNLSRMLRDLGFLRRWHKFQSPASAGHHPPVTLPVAPLAPAQEPESETLAESDPTPEPQSRSLTPDSVEHDAVTQVQVRAIQSDQTLGEESQEQTQTLEELRRLATAALRRLT